MTKPRIHDISLPISESLVVWRGDAPVSITQSAHLARGDTATVSQLTMSAHAGTHVDAPAHFILDGATVEALDLEVLVGPVLVVHTPEAETLSADVLESLAIPPGSERLLFRTRNSERWARGETEFTEKFVGVTEDGAGWLLDRGVRLIGTDYLSAAAFDGIIATHQVLLKAGVILVEGLNLVGIEAGTYQLVCLPLKIVGAEGAPARAILINHGGK
jgi:arylformamidase